MEAGRRVFGRFEITGPLPDQGELEVHAAVDTESGDEVEIIRPSALAALRPGAREHFRAAWRPEHASMLPPGRLPALATGDLDGRPAAVRPRTLGPWPPGLRLEPDTARAVAGWLLSTLSAHPPESAIAPTDILLDASRTPRLAPSGVVPRYSVAQPPLHRPPSVDGPADHARYTIGLALYRACTGQLPFEPTADTALLNERQSSPRPASEAAPALPADLAKLLDALLHADPSVRAAAAVPAPTRPPALTVPDTNPRPAAVARTPPAAPRPVTTGARLDRPLAPFAVVVHTAQATDTALTRLAALVNRGADAFSGSGAPDRLVVEARTEAEAQSRAAELAIAGAPLSVVSTDTPDAARYALLLGVLAATVGAGLAWMLAGPLLALIIGAPGLAAAVWGRSRQAESHTLSRQLKHSLGTAGPATDLTRSPQVRELRRRAQAARRAVLKPELPDIVRTDLLDTIDSLEAAALEDGPEDALLHAIDDVAAAASPPAQAARATTEATVERSKRAVAAARAALRQH